MDVEGSPHELGFIQATPGVWQLVHRRCRQLRKRGQRWWLDIRNSKRRQRKLLGTLELVHVGVLLLLLALFLYYYYFSVDSTKVLHFVSVREQRHDVHLRSEELSCDQVDGSSPLPGYQPLSVYALKDAGEKLLRQRGMTCNCAPLYNVPVRYLTLLQPDAPSTTTVLHLFNPTVTGSLPQLGKSLVTESQELLVPGAGTRDMPRLNGITVSYRDEWCQPQQHSFTHNSAWCIQSCIDLLNGKTIYDA